MKTAGTAATVLTTPTDDDPATPLAGGTLTPVTIDDVISQLNADSTFMGGGTPDLVLSKSTLELVIKTVAKGTNLVLKADSTSTGLGANKLHYTSNQLSTGGAVMDLQIINQAKHALAGTKELLVRALAVAGTAAFTIGSKGVIKKGSGSAEVWCETDSAGALELIITDATNEDILIIAETDNGEIEVNKITTPLP